MKRLSSLLLTIFITPFTCIAQPMNSVENQTLNTDLSQEARGIIKKFAGELKQQLKQGMKSGGPVAAIDICYISAPSIANLNSTNGWTIKRTSLKVRNDKNKATKQEIEVLQEFETKKLQGIKVSDLHYAKTTDNQFVYMQAIGTKKVCLHCHGIDLKTETKEALQKHYPNDTATGFKQGDIRGMFVLIKDLTKG